VPRHQGVDVDHEPDPVDDSIGGSGDRHTPITVSAQDYLVEIFELEDSDDVLDVDAQPHLGMTQVSSFAHPGHRRREHVVTALAK